MDTQPGNVFTPQNNDEGQSDNTPSGQHPANQGYESDSTTAATVPAATQSAAPGTEYTTGSFASQTTPDTTWQYTQEAASGSGSGLSPLPDEVSWSAAEFIEHQKSAGWYGLLFLA